MNKQNTMQAYNSSLYAVVIDKVCEWNDMTTIELRETECGDGKYVESSAVFANNAIEKMMRERL